MSSKIGDKIHPSCGGGIVCEWGWGVAWSSLDLSGSLNQILPSTVYQEERGSSFRSQTRTDEK